MSFLWIVMVGLRVFALDSPDYDKENYFNDIYKSYYSAPTSEEAWNGVLGQRSEQNYTLQTGDTLWDLSKTFFGDGFFWSKLWALNPNIRNPHQVDIGQIIEFYPGDGLQPPSIAVKADESSTAEEGKAPGLSEVAPLAASTASSSEKSKYVPVLKRIPPSLPEWKINTGPPKEISINIVERRAPVSEIPLSHFVAENLNNIVGEIAEMEDETFVTGAEGQYLFVDDKEPLEIGKQYTVVNEIGILRDPLGALSRPKVVEVQGSIKVIEKIDIFYKAQVIKQLMPITVGAMVLNEPMPKASINPKAIVASSGDTDLENLEVIGGEFSSNRQFFGDSAVVFLNGGTERGVTSGMALSVYTDRKARNYYARVKRDKRKIGELKVVRVEQNYSTAIVMKTTAEVSVGDKISLK